MSLYASCSSVVYMISLSDSINEYIHAGSCYFVQTYNQLYVARVLTGISIGGATPIVFSLLADLYPVSKRIKMAMMIGIAMAAGISFGQFMSGMIGPAYGWRVPFLITAVPACICAVLIMTTAQEPPRGQTEEVVVQFMQQQVCGLHS